VSIAEAPGAPLGVPCNRPIPQHLRQPQPLWLPTIQDCFDDVRCQASEREQPADVRHRDALLLRKVGDRLRAAALDSPPPAVGPDERLDQRLVAAWLAALSGVAASQAMRVVGAPCSGIQLLQRIEQPLCLLEVGRLEALGEPAVDRRE
jgi:hypothetical protein